MSPTFVDSQDALQQLGSAPEESKQNLILGTSSALIDH